MIAPTHALSNTPDPHMSPEYVVTLLRDKRGPRAVQTVRQYNTIMGFRTELLNFDMKAADLAFYKDFSSLL